MGPICSPKLYANRNIAAAGWLNALMGGLPDHGAHHALPWITASRLPQATARIAWVLASHQLPGLPQAGSYWAGLRRRLSGKKSARGAALSTSQSLLRVEHHGLRVRQMAVIESWSEAEDGAAGPRAGAEAGPPLAGGPTSSPWGLDF
jgi:hypothetical protein